MHQTILQQDNNDNMLLEMIVQGEKVKLVMQYLLLNRNLGCEECNAAGGGPSTSDLEILKTAG